LALSAWVVSFEWQFLTIHFRQEIVHDDNVNRIDGSQFQCFPAATSAQNGVSKAFEKFLLTIKQILVVVDTKDDLACMPQALMSGSHSAPSVNILSVRNCAQLHTSTFHLGLAIGSTVEISPFRSQAVPRNRPWGRQLKLRNGRPRRLRSCFEGFEPWTDSHAKWRNYNAGKDLWIPVQTAQGRSHQGNRSRAVTALKMVEGSSDLDQPLQESFFRLLRREPHWFPMFVGFKERAGMKAAQTFE
jgi:hypothetical protein